jgi:glycosyltransferase involved in cell wall biosynthesis
MSNFLLTVCIITYNHEKFIAKAIESVLTQQTNFEFKIVIADDFSTDKTREVLEYYKIKYKNKIELLLQKENVGAARNWLDLLKIPSSKYVAYLEGDDFWIDPFKLQMQIDFMESNLDYSFCFHNVKINSAHKNDSFNYPKPKFDTLNFVQILLTHYVPSSSILYRNYDWVRQLPSFFIKSISGDIPFELMLSSKGKVKYFEKEMATYNRNIYSITQQPKDKLQLIRDIIWMYKELSKVLPFKYRLIVLLKSFRYCLSYFKILLK